MLSRQVQEASIQPQSEPQSELAKNKRTEGPIFLSIAQYVGVRHFQGGSANCISSLIINHSPVWTVTTTRNRRSENKKKITNYSGKRIRIKWEPEKDSGIHNTA